LVARPNDVDAWLLAARVARRLHLYDEAAEHLHRCSQEHGPSEPIEVEYALLAVAQGDERPIATLRQRATLEDDLPLTILETLIQFDIDSYRLRVAQQDLNEYLRRRPDDLQARLGSGYVWEKLQSFADALEDYRKAVAAHPN